MRKPKNDLALTEIMNMLEDIESALRGENPKNSVEKNLKHAHVIAAQLEKRIATRLRMVTSNKMKVVENKDIIIKILGDIVVGFNDTSKQKQPGFIYIDDNRPKSTLEVIITEDKIEDRWWANGWNKTGLQYRGIDREQEISIIELKNKLKTIDCALLERILEPGKKIMCYDVNSQDNTDLTLFKIEVNIIEAAKELYKDNYLNAVCDKDEMVCIYLK